MKSLKYKRFQSIIRIILIILVFVYLAQPVLSQDKSQGTIPKIQFEKYTLPNGLQVILHIDRKLPVVHVNQWFYVGSANERTGRTGFAHLFEHMMLQGSKNANRGYLEYVESIGANIALGGANATTRQDRTNYFATVPSGNLEKLLWLESDRLATLPEALTKEKLDNQRDVVKNERRQNLENQPFGLADTIISENLYPQGHPYGHNIYGSHEDLTNASLDDVKEFFRTYYSPNNLSLVITGDFDPIEAKRLVEKYFGTIPPGPSMTRLAKTLPKLEGEKIVETKDRISQERTYLVWHSPAFFDSGDAELDIAAIILTSGLSARLNKALLYDNQLASNVRATQRSQPLSSSFVIQANAREGVDLKQIEQIITNEIERFAQTGPTDEELNRAKNKWEFGFVANLENLGAFGGKSDLLNQYNTYLGEPNKFEEEISNHRNVSKESTKVAVDKYLNTKNRLIVRFRPEKSRKSSDVAINRSVEPPLGIDKPFVAPEVKQIKLENGLNIFVVERPGLPMVNVQLATRAGSIADPVSKGGLSRIATSLMRRGTTTRTLLQIDETLGDSGAILFTSTGKQYVTVNLDSLKRGLGKSLEVMSDIVMNPSFPVEEFNREKKAVIDTIKQQKNNPNSISNNVAYKIAFGANYPYARRLEGETTTVETITREDLLSFHQTNWKPESSALVFVGDITLEEASNLGRQYLGKWSGGSAPEVKFPQPTPLNTGTVYLIDWKGATQTIITHILSAPPRKSADYYPLLLANDVYGGNFGSRLNLNLREEKGYSYGVVSFPVNFIKEGVWLASGSVQTEKTKESVIEFMRELNFLSGEKPISEKELESARLTRLRGHPQRFQTLDRISTQIINFWAADLPTDLNEEISETSKLQLTTVNTIAAKYSVPKRTSILLVGDLSKIEAGIRELNLGKVVILDIDGNPVN